MNRICRLAVGLALAVPAMAQEARLTLIRDDATRDRVRLFIEAARKRGTPTEPLIARALEGVAFKADAKRIEKAMAALESRMLRAQKMLGRSATVDEISAAADALANEVQIGRAHV